MMQRQLTTEEICNKLRPVFGKKIDDIYLKYAMADSREEREEIAHILNALYQKNLSELLDKKVLLEPPKTLDGNYNLATISYANKNVGSFNLREQDWVRHVCVSGMSGSGKTNFGFHIINNFIKQNKPFLIFDWKKSFRPLLKIDNETMLFTVGNDNISNLFRFNINQPPKGVNPKEWINVLCDLLSESFFVSYGVHKILLETLDESFKEWGIYKGSKNYPTWNHIKWRLEEKMRQAKGREAGWIESALRIASVLTFGDFGKTLNYKSDKGLDIQDLLNKKAIFELNSLGNIEKKFFCEFILTYIYKFKKANQTGISNKFESAILVDEAHNIFLKDKTHFVNESITDMIYREMREYGIGLICLDQHISKLSDTVAGNSACHIAFQQQLPADIETISRLMQLNDRKEYFSKLSVGSAIVKLAERYTDPFLIEVGEVDLRGIQVTDMDIVSRMQYLFQVKEVQEGRDEEFEEDLLQKELKQDPKIMDKGKAEPARSPSHSLYNGDVNELMDLAFEDELTLEQKTLYEFIKEKIVENWELDEIEKFMKERTQVGGYTNFDVKRAIDHYLGRKQESRKQENRKQESRKQESNQASNQSSNQEGNVVTSKVEQNKKVYKENNTHILAQNQGKLSVEQERFLAFLQENPEHELSTVAVYKQVGLSARKGNKIKDELLEKHLIKVQEIKYNKGWKKIIRLA